MVGAPKPALAPGVWGLLLNQPTNSLFELSRVLCLSECEFSDLWNLWNLSQLWWQVREKGGQDLKVEAHPDLLDGSPRIPGAPLCELQSVRRSCVYPHVHFFIVAVITHEDLMPSASRT